LLGLTVRRERLLSQPFGLQANQYDTDRFAMPSPMEGAVEVDDPAAADSPS